MTIKFPSVSYLWEQTINSFLRFPLVILSGLCASTIGIYLTEIVDDRDNVFPYINSMLCCALGISFFFFIGIIADRHRFSNPTKWLWNLAGIVLLVLLYLTFPDQNSTFNTSVPYVRYAIYCLSTHLLVAFGPFFKPGEINGFWQYNKALFLRFWSSVLYSGFLYTGLVLALLALDLLFDVDLHNKIYFQLFILIIGFFNTWFFVAGIPENLDELNTIDRYPKGLKIFTQYILLPLLILYLVILYMYGVKIISNWQWPRGLVSYLITFVAILGILCILLLYPFSQRAEGEKIRIFSRLYYFVLIPLVVMLFIAINMRIGEYGITINRFMIILLGVWLSLICLYFIFGGNNIKLIPISLAAMVVLFSFGPWSMFSVSERSQIDRLQVILQEYDILVDGKIKNEVMWEDSLLEVNEDELAVNTGLVHDSIETEIKSIIDYLDDHHGFRGIQHWYQQDIDSFLIANDDTNYNRWKNYHQAEYYMRSMGLKYWVHYYPGVMEEQFNFSASQPNIRQTHEYDYLLSLYMNILHSPDNKQEYRMEGLKVDITYIQKLEKDNTIRIVFNQQDSLDLSFNELIVQLISRYGKISKRDLSPGELRIKQSTEQWDVLLELNDMSISNENDTLRLNNFNGDIQFRKK